eukprot:CFRG2985T1
MSISFKVVNYTGDKVFISGNIPILGNWNPKDALPLTQMSLSNTCASDIVDVGVDEGSRTVEWKVVSVKGSSVDWQTGGNNKTVVQYGTEKLVLYDWETQEVSENVVSSKINNVDDAEIAATGLNESAAGCDDSVVSSVNELMDVEPKAIESNDTADGFAEKGSHNVEVVSTAGVTPLDTSINDSDKIESSVSKPEGELEPAEGTVAESDISTGAGKAKNTLPSANKAKNIFTENEAPPMAERYSVQANKKKVSQSKLYFENEIKEKSSHKTTKDIGVVRDRNLARQQSVKDIVQKFDEFGRPIPLSAPEQPKRDLKFALDLQDGTANSPERSVSLTLPSENMTEKIKKELAASDSSVLDTDPATSLDALTVTTEISDPSLVAEEVSTEAKAETETNSEEPHMPRHITPKEPFKPPPFLPTATMKPPVERENLPSLSSIPQPSITGATFYSHPKTHFTPPPFMPDSITSHDTASTVTSAKTIPKVPEEHCQTNPSGYSFYNPPPAFAEDGTMATPTVASVTHDEPEQVSNRSVPPVRPPPPSEHVPHRPSAAPKRTPSAYSKDGTTISRKTSTASLAPPRPSSRPSRPPSGEHVPPHVVTNSAAQAEADFNEEEISKSDIGEKDASEHVMPSKKAETDTKVNPYSDELEPSKYDDNKDESGIATAGAVTAGAVTAGAVLTGAAMAGGTVAVAVGTAAVLGAAAAAMSSSKVSDEETKKHEEKDTINAPENTAVIDADAPPSPTSTPVDPVGNPVPGSSSETADIKSNGFVEVPDSTRLRESPSTPITTKAEDETMDGRVEAMMATETESVSKKDHEFHSENGASKENASPEDLDATNDNATPFALTNVDASANADDKTLEPGTSKENASPEDLDVTNDNATPDALTNVDTNANAGENTHESKHTGTDDNTQGNTDINAHGANSTHEHVEKTHPAETTEENYEPKPTSKLQKGKSSQFFKGFLNKIKSLKSKK